MIKLYFSQLTHVKNGANQNRSFPLAAGFISQYLLSKFKNSIDVRVFKTPDKLNNALLKEKPDILLLSNYLWNENLSCTFADLTKTLYPDVLVIMGGPNVTTTKSNNIKFLNNHKSIDKLIFHEGEIPASILIENFLQYRDVEKIKALDVFNTMGIVGDDIIYNDGFTKDTKKIGDNYHGCLDEIPSPYLNGMFDEFFTDGEVPLIETNRGCPFTCAFCQQGNEEFKKIRNFSISRIKDEIEYIAQKIHHNNLKMETLYVTDTNFAMYRRDSEILQKIRETQDKYNYPKNVMCSTGKNNAEVIIENISFVKKGTILLRNSVQSLDPETLKAIHRSNIKLDAYEKIQKHIVSIGMESTADIMLGLPKETKESHLNGIFNLIDSNTKEITCLQTIVLKGTELEDETYGKTYDITTKNRVIPSCFNSYNILNKTVEVVELDKIIIKNSSLSFDEYLECRKLHLLVMIFHNTRLLEPLYKVTDIMGIKKSSIYKKLMVVDNMNLKNVLNTFIQDTKNELFDEFSELKKLNQNLEEITSNKIFRTVSVLFYREKDMMMSIVREILSDILQPTYSSLLVEDLLNIIRMSIISPFKELEDYFYEVKSEDLKKIMGTHVGLCISEKQLSMMEELNIMIKNPEDKINIMAYHLKPSNMVRQLNYTQ